MGRLTWKNAPEGRVYISAESYPDEEIVGLAQDVATALSMSMPEVLKAFGEYLFSHLKARHPAIVDSFNSFADLIISIDKVIHVEVAKLYHEPNLPEIDAKIIEDGFILMRYNSSDSFVCAPKGLFLVLRLIMGLMLNLIMPSVCMMGLIRV